MSSVNWCKVYERLVIRFEEKLQDSVVKPVIFTRQKMKLFGKDLFNRCE